MVLEYKNLLMGTNIQDIGMMGWNMAKVHIIQPSKNKHMKAHMKKVIDQEKESFY